MQRNRPYYLSNLLKSQMWIKSYNMLTRWAILCQLFPFRVPDTPYPTSNVPQNITNWNKKKSFKNKKTYCKQTNKSSLWTRNGVVRALIIIKIGPWVLSLAHLARISWNPPDFMLHLVRPISEIHFKKVQTNDGYFLLFYFILKILCKIVFELTPQVIARNVYS